LLAFPGPSALAGPIISGGGEPKNDPAHVIEPDVHCESEGRSLDIFGLRTGTAVVKMDGQSWNDIPVSCHIRYSGGGHGTGCGGDCTEDDYYLRWGRPFGPELSLRFVTGLKGGEGIYTQRSGSNGKPDTLFHCERNEPDLLI
jgi:hypothetical protein